MTSGTPARRRCVGGAGGPALGWVAWFVASLAVLTLWSAYVPAPSRGRLDAFAPFTQLLALRPWLAAAFVILGLLGIALKRRRRGIAAAFGLMTIGALIACAQIAPRALSRAEAVPRGAPTVTILAANTLRSTVAPTVVVGLVRHTDADLIALPETSTEVARSFARALTRDRGERWRAFGDPARKVDDGSPGPTSMVVREALGPRRLAQPAGAPGALGQVRLRLTRLAGGQWPGVAAVHPRAPEPVGSARWWQRDLLALRALCQAGWILAGDFNATIDHSPMRVLLDAGCSDAAASTGQGLKATWSAGPLALVRVPIDHVLSSRRWRADALRRVAHPGQRPPRGLGRARPRQGLTANVVAGACPDGARAAGYRRAVPRMCGTAGIGRPCEKSKRRTCCVAKPASAMARSVSRAG